MGKITFRADEDLIERLEEFDDSKSEVMRNALRTYFEETVVVEDTTPEATVDSALSERVDELISARLDGTQTDESDSRPAAPDVTVTVALKGSAMERVDPTVETEVDSTSQTNGRKTRTTHESEPASGTEDGTCSSCGTGLDEDDVYCPNCGEKASRRAYCECGDEIHTDWSFCPGCGRRTPAADVLD